jgi:hypothetical protein
MLSVRTLARPFRWLLPALVAAAIAAPSAQAFFSADDLDSLTSSCVRKTLAAAGSTATHDPEPAPPARGGGLDWGDAGIGAGLGVGAGLGLGAGVLVASRRRGRLAHA